MKRALSIRTAVLQTCCISGLLFSFVLNAATLSLPRSRFRSGEDTLRAFAPVSEATRHSIVRFNVNAEPVALGAVIDTNGLVLTKASEIKNGKLTCWLATENEVPAEVLAVDQDEDVALVRVHAQGLKPIEWTTDEVSIGQWAITPGIIDVPHAVGIVSALPHKIQRGRALVGVSFDVNSTSPKVSQILPGLGAQKAGLQPGDIIMAVNEINVTNRQQVVEMIRDFQEGQMVKLRIMRADEEFGVDIKLMVPRDGAVSGFDRYRQRQFSRLTGRVSQRAVGFDQAIEHDTVLQPFLCGGPLVNLDGRAIGLNIARASRVSTYALPAKFVREIAQKLKSADKS